MYARPSGYDRNESGIGLEVLSEGLSPNGAEEGVDMAVLAEGLDSVRGGWPVAKCAPGFLTSPICIGDIM